MKQLHLIISGRVQGIFFRASTRDKARQLGLKGLVRNLGNGDVEVIAQGAHNPLQELTEFCRKGPPGAEVDGVDIKYEDAKEKFLSFDVRF